MQTNPPQYAQALAESAAERADRIAQVRALASELLVVSEAEVEAACRAMWASWGRMRPDHERKHRADMRRALEAAVLVRVVPE